MTFKLSRLYSALGAEGERVAASRPLPKPMEMALHVARHADRAGKSGVPQPADLLVLQGCMMRNKHKSKGARLCQALDGGLPAVLSVHRCRLRQGQQGLE